MHVYRGGDRSRMAVVVVVPTAALALRMDVEAVTVE